MGKIEYVVGFLFDPTREWVTLIRKTKPDWQKGLLNGLGGHIEPGETPLEAMRREFREETEERAIDIEKWEHFASLESPEFVLYFFRAESDLVSTLTVSGREGDVGPYRAPLSDREACVSNIRWILPLARNTSALSWGVPFHILTEHGKPKLN